MSVISLQQYAHRHNLPGAAEGGKRQQLQAVAEQFEAIFLQQILKQMRKAGDVFKSDDSMRRREMDMMYGYYDEVLADALARKGQLGIADMLVRQLGGEEGGTAGGNNPSAGGANEINQRIPPLPKPFGSQSAPIDALVESVIQRESAGDPTAVSHKGARGLMQLMPATAREMAAELGLAYDEARLTTDADYNRRLGTAYLEKMLDRYDGHPALALAAYNAGPSRVDDWLAQNGDPREGRIGTDAWVERIPFKETRLYTRRILDDVPQIALRAPEAERQPAPVDAPALPLPFGAVGAVAKFDFTRSPAGQEAAEPLVDLSAQPELPTPWGATLFNSREDSVAIANRRQTTAAPHTSKAFAQPVRVEQKGRF